MKSLIFVVLFGQLMVGCGGEAKKEAVKKEARDDPSVPLAIPCIACGEKVSKKTTECRQCGHPTPDSVVAYKEAQELARIRAELERRKEEAQREELRVRYTNAAFAKLGDRFTISDLGLEMLWVKPGSFMMGSPVGEVGRWKEEILRQVTLTRGFYLGKYEVTQSQWKRVMGNNPSNFKGDYRGADRPVEQVSWNDAVEFCKKLTEIAKKAGRLPQEMSFQLPTEAQWEYACRAGTTTRYSWGDSISFFNANYVGPANTYGVHDETTPVGKYPANRWGFHDMHGNVSEWCADSYADYPRGSVTDPIGPASGSPRVNRGGSWYDVQSSLRSAERFFNTASFRHSNIGFRVSFQSSK